MSGVRSGVIHVMCAWETAEDTMAKKQRLKRAVLKEELVALTGDAISALVLQQFLYWSERVNDHDDFLAEERDRGGNDLSDHMRHGWIWKSARELTIELMNVASQETIRKRLLDIVEARWLARRESPKAWDNTG